MALGNAIGGQADACRESSPVERSFNALLGTLEEVQGTLDMLERRVAPGLSPDLQPATNTNPLEKGPRPPEPPTSMVRESINNANNRAERILHKLHNIINRIEL